MTIRRRYGRLFFLAFALLLLLAGVRPYLQSSDLDAQLLAAAVEGNLEEVAALLDWGAHVDAENEMSVTPLYVAAELGNLEMVKLP